MFRDRKTWKGRGQKKPSPNQRQREKDPRWAKKLCPKKRPWPPEKRRRRNEGLDPGTSEGTVYYSNMALILQDIKRGGQEMLHLPSFLWSTANVSEDKTQIFLGHGNRRQRNKTEGKKKENDRLAQVGEAPTMSRHHSWLGIGSKIQGV